MECLIHLATSKWNTTSFHVSQSSPVILYMLTSPLTPLAKTGVVLLPGDNEYKTGRSSFLRICRRYLFSEILTLNITSFTTNQCIPLIQMLSHLYPNHHQIHSHFLLQTEKQRKWKKLCHQKRKFIWSSCPFVIDTNNKDLCACYSLLRLFICYRLAHF